MDVEAKLGQSLDDLIKAQQKKKPTKKPPGNKKPNQTARKGVHTAGRKTKTSSTGAREGSRRGRGGGIAKKQGRTPTGGRKAPLSVKVAQYDRHGRGGGGVGYGLGPKAGVVTRNRPRPGIKRDGTGQSTSARFDQIRHPTRNGNRPAETRSIHSPAPRGTSRPTNRFGVVLPL